MSTKAEQDLNDAIAPYMKGYVDKDPISDESQAILDELRTIKEVMDDPDRIISSVITDEAGAERWEVLGLRRTSDGLELKLYDRFMEGNTSAVATAAGEADIIATAVADLLPYEQPDRIKTVLLEVPID